MSILTCLTVSHCLYRNAKIANPNDPGEALGRVKMELFAHKTPRTAENFRQFCTGETKNPKGQPQGYKGSKFHRVVCVCRVLPFDLDIWSLGNRWLLKIAGLIDN